jgi:ELP3 family radical SAM enzyme/protein acetyltransferase
MSELKIQIEECHLDTTNITDTTNTTTDNKEEWLYDTFIPYPIKQMNTDENLKNIILSMIKNSDYNKDNYRKFGMSNVTDLLYCYTKLLYNNEIERNLQLEAVLKSSKHRMASGVFVFTVVMSDKPNGQDFTCKWDCSYCPKEPGMPRSYLKDEPAVARGYSFNWDVIKQIRNRMKSYMANGLIDYLGKSREIIKGEFIIEGGTYTSYPESYRYEFMQQLYYACNEIYSNEFRPILSLEEEININENNQGIRVVGLSIETRPDTINPSLCLELRKFGVTKVQLGVQSLFDSVLRMNNRGCYLRHTIKATKLLAEHCFKVQIHIMLDLYGSSVELDKQQFTDLFYSQDINVDAMKVYPCMIVPYTDISTWYENKTYHPYGNDNNKIMDVLFHMTLVMKEAERYDIRIERIIRDIPSSDIIAGCNDLGMGNTLKQYCDKKNVQCICIRCRECVRHNNQLDIILVVRHRLVNDSYEYFITYESSDFKVLYAFLRLRIDNYHSKLFDELNSSGKIRELHVYNNALPVNKVNKVNTVNTVNNDLPVNTVNNNLLVNTVNTVNTVNIVNTQHKGYGTNLLLKAEQIAKSHGKTKLCVISGVGVRNYYKKLGFTNGKYYLVKLII